MTTLTRDEALGLEVEELELLEELEGRRLDRLAGLVPDGARRALFAHELAAKTNFVRLAADLDGTEDDLARQLELDRALFLGLLVKVLAGIESPQDAAAKLLELDGPAGWTSVPEARELYEDSVKAFREALDRALEAGAVGVRLEASAQGLDIPPGLPAPRPDQAKALDLQASRLASGPQVDLVRSLREEASRRSSSVATGAQLAETLADYATSKISGRGLADYARTAASQAHGLGRAVGVSNLPDPAQIYSSELLDLNTCPACFGVDGKEYSSLADSEQDYPLGAYIECDGGDRCRGTRVFVWDTERPPERQSPGDAPPPAPGEPGGGPLPGQAPPGTQPPAPAPELPAAPLEGAGPAGTPVSDALQVSTRVMDREKTEGVLAAIDKVHGDGPLPRIPIKTNNRMGRTLGYFRRYVSGTPIDIQVKFSAGNGHPGLTLAHEIGHFLDLSGLPGNFGRYSSQSPTGALVDWARAVDGSEARAWLLKLAGDTKLLRGPNGEELRASLSHVSYLLTPEETFARSYAQYIAIRSGDEKLLEELAGYLAEHNLYGGQWTPEDFAPIAEAFDRLFEELGWRRPRTS